MATMMMNIIDEGNAEVTANRVKIFHSVKHIIIFQR